MKHLYIIPRGGLCNRLRAIASARRAAELLGSTLSVVWNWSIWGDLFEHCDDFELITHHSGIPQGVPVHQTLLKKHGGDVLNQKLVLEDEIVILESCHYFSMNGLPPITMQGLLGWFLHPNQEIQKMAIDKRQELGDEVVGVHIRRTDNDRSTRESPDELFLAEIDQIAARQIPVYLATDNPETRDHFRRSFPDTVRTIRHRREVGPRWPVKRRITSDVQDDFLDLLVLSKCSWVLGSCFSSFSETSMVLNQDPRCRYVMRPPHSKIEENSTKIES